MALVAWLPRVATAAAVPATALLGLVGVLTSLRLTLPAVGPANWFSVVHYGPLALPGSFYGSAMLGDGRFRPGTFGDMLRIAGEGTTPELVLAAVQGVTLLAVAGVITTRLAVPVTGVAVAGQARALTRRVARLTETRRDATEAAAAELRRIERDLHDGAQARLVAVGMLAYLNT